MIIHISGTSGAGKTILGNLLQKKFGKKVVVYDTDNFMQHGAASGKAFEKIKDNRLYLKKWREILKKESDKIIAEHPDQVVIFVGLLNNWGINNTPYKIHADHKYFLDVSLAEILKRYYLRIYKTEQEVTKKQSEWCWNCLAKGKYSIRSSKQIIKNYNFDVNWHRKNGYQVLSGKKIIDKIEKLIMAGLQKLEKNL